MNLILLHACHAGIPLAHKVNVLVYLVGVDIMEDDRMDIFSACQNRGEAGF
jgi:hypothetical protein